MLLFGPIAASVKYNYRQFTAAQRYLPAYPVDISIECSAPSMTCAAMGGGLSYCLCSYRICLRVPVREMDLNCCYKWQIGKDAHLYVTRSSLMFLKVCSSEPLCFRSLQDGTGGPPPSPSRVRHTRTGVLGLHKSQHSPPGLPKTCKGFQILKSLRNAALANTL